MQGLSDHMFHFCIFVLFLWLIFPFRIYTEEAEKYFFGVERGNGTVLPSN